MVEDTPIYRRGMSGTKDDVVRIFVLTRLILTNFSTYIRKWTMFELNHVYISAKFRTSSNYKNYGKWKLYTERSKEIDETDVEVLLLHLKYIVHI